MKNSIKEIQTLYLNQEKPLYVAYSGGKDSTVTLDIVVKAIMELPAEQRLKEIIVMFSDTLLEMPPVIGQIQNSIESFKTFCDENKLPFIFKQVSPELQDTFWSKLIGIGYTLPRRDYRWCTDRMKIKPMQKAIDEVVEAYGGYIAVTGARKDESADRKERLESNALEGYLHLKKHSDSRCYLLAPIEDMTQDEVWDYIYTKSESWVDKNGLGVIYSEAAGDGDECTSVLEGGETGNKPGCSKSARFGCYICPLFEKDKTLNNLVQGNEYLSYLETFRNWLVQFRDGHWDKRDVYNHRNFKKIEYDRDTHRLGMVSPGGYTLEFRYEIFLRLMEMQEKVQKTNPEFQAISIAELEFIQDRWLKEGDLELRVVEYMEYHYGIEIKYDKKLYENAIALQILQGKEDSATIGSLQYYSHQHQTTRYFVQLAQQLQEKTGNAKEWIYALSGLSLKISQEEAVAFVLELPVETKQYHPTKDMEKIYRQEWTTDTINFVTIEKLVYNKAIQKPSERDLFGYVGERAEEFTKLESVQSNNYNWEEDPNLSFEDKIAILEDAIDYNREEIKANRREALCYQRLEAI
ncbi:phosphoadenosine phosphosulfate reductase family protein [Sulfurimonas indica]|uniref:phosphoadenosine phosphosulfate reductase domain-containing protein n=1 Tax=Sulfurimonas TaxID=202746 RepID=UPI00165FD965|nr:phosphoadenosine phosphosulfate reductase family protein [Sulfurimonas indica]